MPQSFEFADLPTFRPYAPIFTDLMPQHFPSYRPSDTQVKVNYPENHEYKKIFSDDVGLLRRSNDVCVYIYIYI